MADFVQLQRVYNKYEATDYSEPKLKLNLCSGEWNQGPLDTAAT
jgi:hypothetical protein